MPLSAAATAPVPARRARRRGPGALLRDERRRLSRIELNIFLPDNDPHAAWHCDAAKREHPGLPVAPTPAALPLEVMGAPALQRPCPIIILASRKTAVAPAPALNALNTPTTPDPPAASDPPTACTPGTCSSSESDKDEEGIPQLDGLLCPKLMSPPPPPSPLPSPPDDLHAPEVANTTPPPHKAVIITPSAHTADPAAAAVRVTRMRRGFPSWTDCCIRS